MDDGTGSLTRLVLLCGQCNCGCPELLVDQEAPPERRIVQEKVDRFRNAHGRVQGRLPHGPKPLGR